MSDNRPSVGVGVFVWKDGKFLMGKRVSKHGLGTWSVPGGYLEYGESFEEGGAREVLEETGVSISDIQFETATNNVFHSENKHSITIFMKSRWKSGDPKTVEHDKFVDVDWFTYKTMPKELFIPLIELKKVKPETFRDPWN